MIKFSPGMTVAILGFFGLLITLAENSGEIGSKIPIAFFFIFIIIVGLVLELAPKDRVDGIYGESLPGRQFS